LATAFDAQYLPSSETVEKMIPIPAVNLRVSFRDPDGFVFRSGKRIYRCVYPHAAADLRAFLDSAFATAQMERGTLAGATFLHNAPGPELSAALPAGSAILEHRGITFPNFPYEWAPEMLQRAAALTLRLAEEALAEGFGLKDATPYNIMFEGPAPVFLDVLSFERRDPLDSTWRPYAQFVQTFLYPLLANQYLGLQLDEILLTHREGLDPARLRRLCSFWLSVRPPFLWLATIPAWISGLTENSSSDRYRARRAKDAGEARFLLQRVFARAERFLRRIPRRRSEASRYMDSGHKYAAAELALKEEVVKKALAGSGAHSVLDIGCNTGHFSLLAARLGARVVAIDRDPAAVEELWNAAAERNADILPLVIDIARPPGAAGWANREHASFLERARGRFDCVLMLALVHQLIVNERVPLDSLFELIAELTVRLAVIEYIDPADAQFQRILRGRDALHRDLTAESFEAAAGRHFRIVDIHNVTPTRRIYTLEKAGH
jgi:SAM-dependent methyltransferase